MERALIFIGGEAPDVLPLEVMGRYSRIIAADSGYDKAKAFGISPDIVLGDMDSTGYRDEIIDRGFSACPEDKDDSDFVLALKAAGTMDYDLIGGGEGRLDHLISILSAFHDYRAPKLWLTRCDVLFCSRHFKAELEEGTQISFFPADLSKSARVSTSGLVWDLDGHDISLSFISLSNRVEKRDVEIVSSESLLIRFPMDFFRVKPKILLC